MRRKGQVRAAGEGVARGTIIGTCTLMCPEAERSFRERMRDIDSFERSAEGGPA